MDIRKAKCRISIDGLGEAVLFANAGDSRNVFLVDKLGAVVWQIQAATDSHGVQGFSDLYLGAQSALMAYGANGIEYQIDKQTGHIVNKELIR